MNSHNSLDVSPRSTKVKLGFIAYVLLFFIVCSLPLIGLAIGLENPSLEKRALAQPPTLVVDGQVNLKATRQFDDYYADHFAFRSYLVTAYHKLNQLVLGQSGNSKVIAGRSGWLFFGETLPDHLGLPVMSGAEMHRLSVTLSIQKEYLESMDIDFHFMVTPNKNSVYSQFMPRRLSTINPENNLKRWLANPLSQTTSTIDLLAVLKEAAMTSETPLYHQTDTHWNHLGARIGFQSMMSAIADDDSSFTYDDFSSLEYTVRKDWQGDLAAMLYPTGVTMENQYYFDLGQHYRTSRPMRSLEDLLIQTTLVSAGKPAFSAAERKIWMFRDSFANALIPMIANTFGKATFTREIPYNYASIDKNAADVVVLQIVERNLPQLLLRAPIVPAPERKAPEGIGMIDDNTHPEQALAWAQALEARPKGGWLGLTGHLSGQHVNLDTISQIMLGIEDENGIRRYVEATPISETAGVGDVGLTAYLTEGHWHSGNQMIDVYYRAADEWHHQETAIILP